MLARLNQFILRIFSRGWLLALGCGLANAEVKRPVSLPPVQALTNVAQLRALSPSEAAMQVPVRIRGTVTGFNRSSIFLQDETGGTFINYQATEPPLIEPGTIIDAEGVSYVGRFVTGITAGHFRVVGNGPLPSAVPVGFDELISAQRHYERVQISGIVRSVTRVTEFERFVLNVAVGPRKLEVLIVAHGVTNLPPLVDVEVRFAGLAAGYINNWRQLVAPQLLVSRMEDIEIESPPPDDPFNLPLTDSSTLLNFSPSGVSNHRVRVRGVVTLRQPGEALYLRDGDRGLLVRTEQGTAVQPGDIVEAAGFPVMGRFSAFLDDAEFRVKGTDAAPAPMPTTLPEALTGTNDANLVTLDAQVIEVLHNSGESVLVLRSADTAFRARMPRAAVTVRQGSSVRVTGVCSVEEYSGAGGGFGVNAHSIELLLRSPRDVEVLAAASAWTAQRLAVAVAILLGLALAAFVWIAMLRRRLGEQAAVIREKVQREAALEERHRMAREMHDTLAQSFSGLGYQLDALNAQISPEAAAARKQLEMARQMVRHGQEGFRRSLMNLRAQELERGSLGEALVGLARQITAGTGIQLKCEMQRSPRGLPESVEANLLRIGQECLANAVRHGRPEHIQLTLDQTGSEVRLRIADDGAGFDPEQLKQTGNGHFGWMGIGERAGQIGARVELQSQPGRGTTVTVTVPA